METYEQVTSQKKEALSKKGGVGMKNMSIQAPPFSNAATSKYSSQLKLVTVRSKLSYCKFSTNVDHLPLLRDRRAG
jgi:hypothetical protein